MNTKEHIEHSIVLRGKYLHEMSLLEMSLNQYLAIYFCGIEKHQQVIDIQILIFGDDRMTLSNKAQVFYYIASHHDKDWYNKYTSVNKNMNKDLIDVIEHRNVFAHKILDGESIPVFANKQKDTTRFVRFKNGINAIDYTNEEYQELINTIRRLTAYLKERLHKSIYTHSA